MKLGMLLVLVLVFCFLLSNLSSATYYVCPTDIDYGCSWNPLTWPECWAKRFYHIISCAAFNLITGLHDLIDNNPDISRFTPTIEQIITTLYIFYVVAILITAIYIMLISASPYNRSRAKSILLRLLLGLILISLSMDIYEILLTLSASITKSFLAESILTKKGMERFELIMMMIMVMNFLHHIPLIFLTIVIILAWLSVIIRYLLVVIMAILFPIGIFLYSFELTRGIGIHIIRYALVAIFTQPLQALMFLLMIISLNTLGQVEGWGALLLLFLVGASFTLIAIAPLMTSGAMKWVGGGTAAIGFNVAYGLSPRLGSTMVLLGALGAGVGPAAFETAAAAYVLGGRYFTLRRDARYMSENYNRFKRYIGSRYSSLETVPMHEEFEKALKDAENYYTDLKRMGKSKELIRQKMENAKYGWYLPREEIERGGMRYLWAPLPAVGGIWFGRKIVRPVVSRVTRWGVRVAETQPGMKMKERLKPVGRVVPERIRRRVVDRARLERYKMLLDRVNKMPQGAVDKAAEILIKEMKREGLTDKNIESIGSDIETLKRKFGYSNAQIRDPNMRDTIIQRLADYRVGKLKRFGSLKRNMKAYLTYRSVVRDKNIPYSQRLRERIITRAGRERNITREMVFDEIVRFAHEDLEINKYKFSHRETSIERLTNLDRVRNYLRGMGVSGRDIKRLEGRARIDMLEDKIREIKRKDLEQTLKQQGRSHGEIKTELKKLDKRLDKELEYVDRISGDNLDKFKENLKRELKMSDSEIRNYESQIGSDEILNKFKEIAIEVAREPYLREALDLEERWIRRYNELYHKFGDRERAAWGATADLISSTAVKYFSNISSQYTELGPPESVAYSVSLSENLHARMLLEDYMGFGPRPSEFYVGLGPETRREWEERMKGEDAEVWKKILGVG